LSGRADVNGELSQGQLLRTIPIEACGEAEQIKPFGEPIELAGKALAIEIYEHGYFGRIRVMKDIALVQRRYGAINDPRLLCDFGLQ
jgi:hypothetical protein